MVEGECEYQFEAGVLPSKVHAVGSGLDTFHASASNEAGVSTGLTSEQSEQ